MTRPLLAPVWCWLRRHHDYVRWPMGKWRMVSSGGAVVHGLMECSTCGKRSIFKVDGVVVAVVP